MRLQISLEGSGIRSLAEAITAIGEEKARQAYARAINRVGEGAMNATAGALARQTGLPVRVTRKALENPIKATPARLEFFKGVRGDDIGLKHFKARETLKGVSAAPFGQRRVFAHTFQKGALFPRRVELPSLNGHVFLPDTAVKRWGRLPIVKQKSGVVLPEQVLQGASRAAFEAHTSRLAGRVEHEIRVITKGIVS